MPNIMKMFNNAKKETFLKEVKKVYSMSEEKYISSSLSGTPVRYINSKTDNKLNLEGKKLDYCIILNSQGEVNQMAVTDGQYRVILDENQKVTDLKKEDIEEGNLDGYGCNNKKIIKPIYCKYDGELTQGAEFVHGQYTYRYNQFRVWNESNSYDEWKNMNEGGWAVMLTNRDSTAPVTSEICTYINDKPIVSMRHMYRTSNAVSINLSTINTSNVTYMSDMFAWTNAKTLDLSNFDTSKVTTMATMFTNSKAQSLDLSNFDVAKVSDMWRIFRGTEATSINLNGINTSNARRMSEMFRDTRVTSLNLSSFNTNKVTDMSYMFYGSKVPTLDLSSFDTKNVTNMENMFTNSKTTTGYARAKIDADKFNSSSNKPSGLNFVVK